MTVLDDKLVPKALEIIDKFGLNAIFNEVCQTDYVAATGAVTEINPKCHTRKITPPALMDRYADGDTVKVGDMKVSVAASGLPFTMEKGMRVEIDELEYTIISVISVYSGASVAIYDLQLRQ